MRTSSTKWQAQCYPRVVPWRRPELPILVVEDDSALRTLYRTVLLGAGYPVIAVEDGLAALRRIEEQAPLAVVLDLDLPRLGGRDVQRELAAHAETRDVPVIVVTGTDASDLDPEEYGSVLHKPVSVDSLLLAVERCVHQQQALPPRGGTPPAPPRHSA